MLLVYVPQMSLSAILEKKNILLGIIYIIISVLVSLLWSYIERKITISQSVMLNDILLQMKSMVFDKILCNNMLSFENNEYYNEMLRALNYAESAGDALINIFSKTITCALTLAGVSYTIGSINLFVVFFIILLMLLSNECMKKSNQMWFDYQQMERLPRVRFINYISTLFSNKDFVSEIKINNANAFAKGIVSDKTIENANYEAKKDSERFRWNFLAIVLNSLHQISSNVYFLILLFKNIISFATYSTLIAAIQTFSSNFAQLLGLTVDIRNKVKEAEFFIKFLDDSSYAYAGKKEIKEFNNIILTNVKLKYPHQSNYALDGISMEIKKGDKIAIVGLNGSGKTTLIKILMGLYPKDSGEIFINNEKIENIFIESWFKKIAVVFQKSFHLPIEINKDIALSETIDLNLLENSIKFVELNHIVDNLPFGYDTIISKKFDEYGQDFSGGEKQKISIARAYYKNADILIFDEPSSALDANSEYNLFKQIEKLGKEKTVIYISHRLSAVVNAEKIYFIENGKIAESGSHRELLDKKGKYWELFVKQASNYVHGGVKNV